jgi:hypothetical protein
VQPPSLNVELPSFPQGNTGALTSAFQALSSALSNLGYPEYVPPMGFQDKPWGLPSGDRGWNSVLQIPPGDTPRERVIRSVEANRRVYNTLHNMRTHDLISQWHRDTDDVDYCGAGGSEDTLTHLLAFDSSNNVWKRVPALKEELREKILVIEGNDPEEEGGEWDEDGEWVLDHDGIYHVYKDGYPRGDDDKRVTEIKFTGNVVDTVTWDDKEATVTLNQDDEKVGVTASDEYPGYFDEGQGIDGQYLGKLVGDNQKGRNWPEQEDPYPGEGWIDFEIVYPGWDEQYRCLHVGPNIACTGYHSTGICDIWWDERGHVLGVVHGNGWYSPFGMDDPRP